MADSRIHPAAVATPSPMAAPPPPQPSAPPSIAAHPFAEMLRQNRLAATPATPEPAASEKADDAAPAGRPAGTTASDSSTAPEPAPSPRSPTSGKARPTDARAPASTRDEAATSAADAVDPSSSSASTPGDSSQNPSTARAEPVADATTLVAMQAAAAQAADLRSADSKAAAGSEQPAKLGSGSALPSGAGTSAASTTGASASRRAAFAAVDDAPDSDPSDAGRSPDSSAAGSFAAVLADTRPASTATRSAHAGMASSLALAQPAPGTVDAAHAVSNGASTVASASVSVPVQSPDFAAAFGMQVSTLTKDGVQRAELHLNPADLGPVSVSITLDGSQARVDFGADMAATRHAIEAGLPELASALRDAGFTLAGGGVAQHSGSGARDEADASGQRGRSSALPASTVASLDSAARRIARAAATGGVDLYA